MVRKVKNYISLRWLGLAVALVWIVLDQATKHLSLAYLTADPVAVIDGVFNLRLAFNRGVSFSMLSGVSAEDLPEYLGIFALVVSVYIIHHMGKHKEKLPYILGLGFVAGGAIGNAIDRFLHGAVVDFLDFYYKTWHWPTFNLADVAIFIGVVLMLWDAYKESTEVEDSGDKK